MFGAFKSVRAGERRDTWVGFVTLFGLIASHSVLETARDALFLAKLPATRLPWVYVAIAIVSLVVTQFQARIAARVGGRIALCLWMGAAAVITLAFWRLSGEAGASGLYALYIWSGVLTTLVLVHLWTLLGDIFTVTQAKRVYGAIGAGSVFGAIAGSSAATGLSQVIGPNGLVLVSAAGFALTSLIPMAFRRVEHRPSVEDGEIERPPTLVENARLVARQPYALRVVMLMVAATAALTFADYLFKDAVSRHVPPADMARFLGTVYVALNVLSAISQLGLVGWVIRRFDISVALAVLPALLVVGGVGAIAFGGIAAALVIKGADGGLRYSLYRTSTELLYVPLSEEARRRIKAFMDVVGQRGGQVLASVTILAAVALAAPRAVFAGALVVLALIWIASALDLRRHYLEIFRRRLRRGRLRYLDDFPEFDVASLETLIASLDSRIDKQVLAALEVLEAEGKARLIPGLILYHPSPAVALRAMQLFARSRRTNVVPILDRLLEHDDPQIRAAAIATRSVLDPDEAPLRMRLSLEEAPEVRATIMVNLIASGAIVGSDAKDALTSMLRHGSVETHVALAEAIARRHAAGFESAVIELASSTSAAVRLAACQAMEEAQSPSFLEPLIGMLADERTRAAARHALASYGDAGLEALSAALVDPDREQGLRWQLPGAIAQFDASRAAPVLLARLPNEWDGMVRYKCIRALEGMVRRDPKMALDERILRRTIDDTMSRAYRYIDRWLSLVRGAAEDPSRVTPGYHLLINMLRDKERHTIGRLFRLLGLIHRDENFADIYRGWKSSVPEQRASSIELIENTLTPPLRSAVMGLIDDMPDEDRLEMGSDYHEPLRLGYEELLADLLASSSDIVQDMTAFHIRELELARFVPQLRSLPATARRRSDIALTLAALDASRPAKAAEVARAD